MLSNETRPWDPVIARYARRGEVARPLRTVTDHTIAARTYTRPSASLPERGRQNHSGIHQIHMKSGVNC